MQKTMLRQCGKCYNKINPMIRTELANLYNKDFVNRAEENLKLE